MRKLLKCAALTAAGTLGLLVGAPASAAPIFDAAAESAFDTIRRGEVETGTDSWQHSRYRDGRRYRNYRGSRYRGRHAGYYRCRRGSGTGGMIIGGAAGALIGRELDGGYNRSTGTILGAAGGALLGREVARNRRCR